MAGTPSIGHSLAKRMSHPLAIMDQALTCRGVEHRRAGSRRMPGCRCA
ncbi:MAG: hypothetical protein AVDCRST_MAG33-1049 [uncultured Thermomicrobiales bacterium]|uniref:Uncharacterized protein n=1 Tax=uncultured Thermomicrobiales bacterium TaxID=1645740 RepID=A0A6J4UKJ6_9BACT|nr:MAG: hypothetical protein AVDCRST_MAG33-1049 [uncultured Thermomicrobiales bacterium]